jgi:tRNA A-37 threonylcarbamoyl transferase component Bud32
VIAGRGGRGGLSDEVRPKDQEAELNGDSGPVDPGADTVDQPTDSAHETETATEGEAAPAEIRKTRRSAPLRCQEFGEYRIVEEVARGAMGIVYRAEQKRLGREVALKVMLTGEHSSEADVRRFTREAQALARLRHPNIVPIHDIGEVDGRHYFTMDFVEGQTLSQILQERELAVTEALHIIEQVADAVAAAHTRGVIHRDIKPSNIMLDSDGGVLIMDFGLAKSAGTESKHTRDGTTIGTPGYMPPEQAKGELSRVDERSDIYSMGAVLYEMLAGRPPFGGTNLLEIVLAVINEDPPRPRTVNSRLSRELETIVVKCMEKDPARRYHTAAELRDEIRRYRSGEPIHAQPPSFFYLLNKKVRKHRGGLTMVAAVLLIAVVAAGAVYWIKGNVSQVEKTEAKWMQVDTCDFSPGELASDWRVTNRFHDYYLTPVLAEAGDAWIQGKTLVSRKPVYGSVRASMDFKLSVPLKTRPLALGFYGEQMRDAGVERASCVFRISERRVQLFANIEPEKDITPRVVADRYFPELKVGTSYRLTAERHGITMRFALQEHGAEGELLPLVELVYAHPHLSNWRYKNLNVVLHLEPRGVHPRLLSIERLSLPLQTSALIAADSIFFRGDYNGAFDEYRLIASPVRERGKVHGALERATANFRLGLYYEIKRQPVDAIRHYGKARKLSAGEALPASEKEKQAYAGLRAEALLREIDVCSRSGLPDKVYELLGDLEEVPAAQLSGPWMWELSRTLPELAKLRPEHAAKLATCLRPPPGSAVMGSRVQLVAATLDRRKMRPQLGELLKHWLPLLQPVPQPLNRWALLSARAGDAKSCTALLRQGMRLLGPGERRQLVDAATQACAVFRTRREFENVKGVIVATRYDPNLRPAFREALRLAIKTNRASAQDLLAAAARSKPYASDVGIARLAVRLGNTYVRDGKYAQLNKLDDAYHTELMAAVYASGVAALREPEIEAPVEKSLALLRQAHRRFEGNNPALAKAAAEISASYAGCENPEDYKWVREAHAAYPSELHAPHLLQAFMNLLEEPRYDHAGEIFAYSRGNLIAGRKMKALVRELLEHPLVGEDLMAFMEQLATVEPQMARRRSPTELADWRLELARYHLLASNSVAAAKTYRRTGDKRAKAPKRLRIEALLRLGLLKALSDNMGKGERAEVKDIFDGLGKLAAKGSRAWLIAGAMRDRELLGDEARISDFRSRARRLKMSRSEIELVLAANASLSREAEALAAKARLVAHAYKIITQEEKTFAWPYELIRFKQEAALRPHG